MPTQKLKPCLWFVIVNVLVLVPPCCLGDDLTDPLGGDSVPRYQLLDEAWKTSYLVREGLVGSPGCGIRLRYQVVKKRMTVLGG